MQAWHGFAWVRTRGMLINSCYCTPKWNEKEFSQFLMNLDASISSLAGNKMIIVGGDFNVHKAEWGSTTEDRRGRLLSDFAASIGLNTCNVGNTPTYRRVDAQSVVDVTFLRPIAGAEISGWKVHLELNSESDHDYIMYTSKHPTKAGSKPSQSTVVPIKG